MTLVLLKVLLQQIGTVVVAVGCSYDGVDVVFQRDVWISR